MNSLLLWGWCESKVVKYKKTKDLLVDGVNFNIEEYKVTNYPGMNVHYHEHYEIYYLLSDNIKYLICDKSYKLENGTLVLIKPFDFHRTMPDKAGVYHRILLNLNPNMLTNEEQSLLGCFERSAAISLNENQRIFIENILRRMLMEKEEQKQFCDLELKSLLLAFLVYVNRNIIPAEGEKSNFLESESYHKFNDILRFVSENYQNYISLNELSAKFSLTPYHICKLFKSNLGVTFIDYLNNAKIKEAQKLLIKTDIKIIDVAITAGFESSSHFGKTFKKITGITPSEYRERNI